MKQLYHVVVIFLFILLTLAFIVVFNSTTIDILTPPPSSPSNHPLPLPPPPPPPPPIIRVAHCIVGQLRSYANIEIVRNTLTRNALAAIGGDELHLFVDITLEEDYSNRKLSNIDEARIFLRRTLVDGVDNVHTMHLDAVFNLSSPPPHCPPHFRAHMAHKLHPSMYSFFSRLERCRNAIKVRQMELKIDRFDLISVLRTDVAYFAPLPSARLLLALRDRTLTSDIWGMSPCDLVTIGRPVDVFQYMNLSLVTSGYCQPSNMLPRHQAIDSFDICNNVSLQHQIYNYNTTFTNNNMYDNESICCEVYSSSSSSSSSPRRLDRTPERLRMFALQNYSGLIDEYEHRVGFVWPHMLSFRLAIAIIRSSGQHELGMFYRPPSNVARLSHALRMAIPAPNSIVDNYYTQRLGLMVKEMKEDIRQGMIEADCTESDLAHLKRDHPQVVFDNNNNNNNNNNYNQGRWLIPFHIRLVEEGLRKTMCLTADARSLALKPCVKVSNTASVDGYMTLLYHPSQLFSVLNDGNDELLTVFIDLITTTTTTTTTWSLQLKPLSNARLLVVVDPIYHLPLYIENNRFKLYVNSSHCLSYSIDTEDEEEEEAEADDSLLSTTCILDAPAWYEKVIKDFIVVNDTQSIVGDESRSSLRFVHFNDGCTIFRFIPLRF